MKTRALLFALCLTAAASPAFSQQKYLKKFQRNYYDRAETHRIGLGFLIKVGRGLIPARLIGDEDVTTIKHLLKKVSKLKIYTITPDNHEAVAADDIVRLRQTLVDKAHLEPLLEVRDKESHVYMLNKGKNDELGNVVMLVQDDEDMVMLHFHTRLKMEDIQDLINRSIAKNDTSRQQTM